MNILIFTFYQFETHSRVVIRALPEARLIIFLIHRTIFEGVYVFAANNRKMGNMDQRDFDTYMELFESMMEVVEMPELMIYLRSSVPHLVKNIQKRGRDYEQKMPIDYLEGINLLYDDFIMNKYKGRVLVVEVDNLDFEHNPKQFGDIIDKIDAKLFGFFSKEE